jgi:hypothetical protein
MENRHMDLRDGTSIWETDARAISGSYTMRRTFAPRLLTVQWSHGEASYGFWIGE